MAKRKIRYPDFVDQERIAVENYGYDNEMFRFLLKVPFVTDGENFLYLIMKNPSRANEKDADMTMIKVCNAAYAAGYDGVTVLNLFPYRATYAKDVYEKFCVRDRELYEKAMAANKQIIKDTCCGRKVAFAWGTNTICKTKEFDAVYDKLAEEVVEIICHCAERAVAPCLDKQGKYPLHALRWWKDILVECENAYREGKHPVKHRNMFGPTAEVCGTNPEDLKIYCHKEHKICVPRKCDRCEFFGGEEMGQGKCCIWEETYRDIEGDEHIVPHDEAYFEFQRVENPELYKTMVEMLEEGDLDLCKVWSGLD